MASTYLTNTNPTAGNRTKGTISVWFKRSGLGSYQLLYSEHYDGNNYGALRLNSNDTLGFFSYDSGNAHADINTNRVFRDTNAWYHVVASWDTTDGTASDRVKIYINGVRETSFSGSPTYPSSSANMYFGIGSSSYPIRVGSISNTAQFFDGSMSHFHRVDNQALAPTVFGSTDSTTGEWKINTSPSITYTGSSDFNFFILKDGNSVTDQSGQSNNLTVGGGTLTKTEDNPSNVFATMQFAGHPGTYTLNNGNLALDGANNNSWKYAFLGTIGANAGKYYWEIKLGMHGESTTDYNIMGVLRNDKTWTNSTLYSNGGFNGLQSANSAGGLGIYSQTGASMGSALYIGGSSVSLTNGDIVMYALDLDNRKMWVGKNGVWANAGSGGGVGNPSTGANELWGSGEFTTGSDYLPASIIYYDNSQAYNFGNGIFKTTAITSAGTNTSGNGIFEYDVPTGFTAWSTKGLNL